MVVDLRRGANGQIVLNQLFKHTQMEETFGVIMLALVNNQPRVLNLKQIRFKHHSDGPRTGIFKAVGEKVITAGDLQISSEIEVLNPDLHINLALLCEKLDLAAKASEHWKRYLQLEPNGSWSEVARLRLEGAE